MCHPMRMGQLYFEHGYYNHSYRKIDLETILRPEDILGACLLATIDESRRRGHHAKPRFTFRAAGRYENDKPRVPENFAIVSVLAIKATDGHSQNLMPESIPLSEELPSNFRIMWHATTIEALPSALQLVRMKRSGGVCFNTCHPKSPERLLMQRGEQGKVLLCLDVAMVAVMKGREAITMYPKGHIMVMGDVLARDGLLAAFLVLLNGETTCIFHRMLLDSFQSQVIRWDRLTARGEGIFSSLRRDESSSSRSGFA